MDKLGRSDIITFYLLFYFLYCVLLTSFKKTFIKFQNSFRVSILRLNEYHTPVISIFKNKISFQQIKFVWIKQILIKKNNFNRINSIHLLSDNIILFLITNNIIYTKYLSFINHFFQNFFKKNFIKFLTIFKATFGDGALYLRGLLIIFFVDALIVDDEPLWEPVEWSLVQSWIMFIFLFAWIAENLISSRYGSYTGRDKRVWFAWYKTFWLVEGWYIISLGLASLWVIVPHYYEITYSVSFIFSWWNWYSRVFFFKFISIYTIVLFIAYYLQITMRWVTWKNSFLLIIIINLFLSYLLYIHFFMSFFGYFTDPNWYHKTRLTDYVQLSHEPNKWAWGPAKRDNFLYHNSKTVFWFKNDGPFAGAFLFFNLFFFISLFLLYIYWITLIRKVYSTQEITFTYTTYCISGLKQFFYMFSLIFVFVILSYVFNYWRLPIEFYWSLNANSWFNNLLLILKDYPTFLISIF